MTGFGILVTADQGTIYPGGTGTAAATGSQAATGSRGIRTRRASDGDAAEREAGSFAAALMMVRAQAETPPEAIRIDASLERLDPEFRRRLERVMQRMQNEYGHEVRLVEGFRDAARQDFLYARGRTRPGPVVTWTRDSVHEHGLAADLLVDGRYDNPEGYARLAQVAREEGLRTLGPADAGHVELARPAAAQRARAESATNRLATRPASQPANGLARLATPAAVAPTAVASVAQVSVADTASVARVAVVAPVAPATGAVAPGASMSAAAAPRAVAAGAAAPEAAAAGTAASVRREVGPRTAPAPAGARGDAVAEDAARIGSAARAESVIDVRGDARAEPPIRLASTTVAEATTPIGAPANDAAASTIAFDGHSSSHERRDSRSRGAADDRGSGRDLTLAADGRGAEPRSTHAADMPAGDVAPRGPAAPSHSPIAAATGAGDVERVVRVLELQEAAETAPRSRVVLRLEDADGGVGRVRVDLRGSAVDAEISVPDRQLAARLDARMDALDSALRREGLIPESLRAQAAPTVEAGDAVRHAFTAPTTSLESASGAASGSAADRDRRGDDHDPTRDAHRRDANDRQRSPKEDRHERGRPW